MWMMNGKRLFCKKITIVFLLLFCFQAEAKQRAPERIEGATIVNAEELIELFSKHENTVVIDARLASDRKQGYIEGSVNLENTLTDCNKLFTILKTMSVPVVFYCNGDDCSRSADSIKIALSCGYNNVYWFRGGFHEWLLKGYPYLRDRR